MKMLKKNKDDMIELLTILAYLTAICIGIGILMAQLDIAGYVPK